MDGMSGEQPAYSAWPSRATSARNLSLGGAKAQMESAGKELASSYQQTFASINRD